MHLDGVSGRRRTGGRGMRTDRRGADGVHPDGRTAGSSPARRDRTMERSGSGGDPRAGVCLAGPHSGVLYRLARQFLHRAAQRLRVPVVAGRSATANPRGGSDAGSPRALKSYRNPSNRIHSGISALRHGLGGFKHLAASPRQLAEREFLAGTWRRRMAHPFSEPVVELLAAALFFGYRRLILAVGVAGGTAKANVFMVVVLVPGPYLV